MSAFDRLDLAESAARILASEEKTGATPAEGARWACRGLGQGAVVAAAEWYPKGRLWACGRL